MISETNANRLGPTFSISQRPLLFLTNLHNVFFLYSVPPRTFPSILLHYLRVNRPRFCDLLFSYRRRRLARAVPRLPFPFSILKRQLHHTCTAHSHNKPSSCKLQPAVETYELGPIVVYINQTYIDIINRVTATTLTSFSLFNPKRRYDLFSPSPLILLFSSLPSSTF